MIVRRLAANPTALAAHRQECHRAISPKLYGNDLIKSIRKKPSSGNRARAPTYTQLYTKVLNTQQPITSLNTVFRKCIKCRHLNSLSFSKSIVQGILRLSVYNANFTLKCVELRRKKKYINLQLIFRLTILFMLVSLETRLTSARQM